MLPSLQGTSANSASGRYVGRVASFLERIGAVPSDPPELRLKKQVLVGISLPVAIAAVAWGSIYAAFGEWLAAAIPWSYAAASALSLAVFAMHKRYRVYRASQLALILLLPFLLQLVLGGFVNSSAVILWALLAPVGALLIADRRLATLLFVAYVLLVVVAAIGQPSVVVSNELSDTMIVLFFVMNVVGVSLIVFETLVYFVSQKNSALHLLDLERGKSDRLLVALLPGEVADVLREEKRTIADRYDDASVLFADVAGFTTLAGRLPPEEIVMLLNDMFSHFDELAARHGVEKIRTMGDAYMAAAGVPTARPDHAQALADLALDMVEYANARPGSERLELRLGIASGPLVAGVIGTARFQYDVWGDTVNTASRMESHGAPGRIQITDATYQLLGDEYTCTPRGTVEVKGKGSMATWFLEGKRPLDGGRDAAADPPH